VASGRYTLKLSSCSWREGPELNFGSKTEGFENLESVVENSKSEVLPVRLVCSNLCSNR